MMQVTFVQKGGFDTEKENHSSVIIAFDLKDDLAVKALQVSFDKEDIVEDLHMTLLFLGDVDDFKKEDVLERLEFLAINQAPIDGKYTGFGLFNPEESDKQPVVLLFDSPQLPFLRLWLSAIFNEERDSNHGFIPHVTLAYVDKPVELVTLDEQRIFDTISLWWGDEHYDFPLTGEFVEKSKEDAPNYRLASGENKCQNCNYFHEQFGDQQSYCEKFDFNANFIWVCDAWELVTNTEKGGKGSGHFGHSGRPDKVGGSLPGKGGGSVVGDSATEYIKKMSQHHSVRTASSLNDIPNNKTSHIGFLYNGMVIYAPRTRLQMNEHGHLLSMVGHPRSIIDNVYKSGVVKFWDIPHSKQFVISYYGDLKRNDHADIHSFALLRDRTIDYEGIKIDSVSGKMVRSDFFYGVKPEDIPDVLKQLPIGKESKDVLIGVRTNIFYDEVEYLAEQVYSGEITIGGWEEDMKQKIRGLYTSIAAIGKGGWGEMSFADWGRLGTPLREQYKFLHGFAEKIATDMKTISLQYIKGRSRLYGRSGGYAATLMEAGLVIEEELPWIPKDSSTFCNGSCHCIWLLKVIERLDNGVQVVRARWKLNPAEHCETCVGRRGYVTTIQVDGSVIVPEKIGGY